MFTKTFFKLFPPPKFLNIPYAGIDISDDAVRCIEYSENIHGLTLHRHGMKLLEPGIVESGRIVKETELINIISTLAKELKLHTIKASLPEERMYLFKTEVPMASEDQIRQNIEFKLEENVPLPAADAVFFFDLIPSCKEGEIKNYASVSVAPIELVNSYLNVLRASGLDVVSFEIQPKAIARAVIPLGSEENQMIVHIMNNKTGIYIVCGGVVCFTSTVALGKDSDSALFQHELSRVYSYWGEYGADKKINQIIITGQDAQKIGSDSRISPDPKIPVEIAHIWQNAFSSDRYIPSITFEDSLQYVIAAGLALP
jgi:Tfp pilus assembly PilM family ATPase